MSEIIIYSADQGIQIDVKFENESVWLSLNQISTLFGRDKSVISRHLKNIFLCEELVKSQVVAKNATTALDLKSYIVEFYNLDAIISVGYRVNSIQGTKFRQWATKCLKDHLVKGYSLNQKRLEELNQIVKIIEQSTKEDELLLSEFWGSKNK